MTSTLSRAVYRSLTALGAPPLMRRLRAGAPVFCFHNVVAEADAGVGDTSLHMPVGSFAAIVAWMAASYEVVALGDLVDRAAAGRSVRGLAALTFDDAYRGVFEHALPLLAAVRMPCTISVVTSLADEPAYTWWDDFGARGLLSEERRDRALSVHCGLAAEVRSAEDGVEPTATLPAASLPDALLPAPWKQIMACEREGLVELGSHTVRHANLSVLNEAGLDDELRRSHREIRERTGRDAQTVAYPYGLWNERVLRAAGRAGYRIGLRLDGGLFAAGQDPLGVPRINVPAGISVDALACWAASIRPRRPW